MAMLTTGLAQEDQRVLCHLDDPPIAQAWQLERNDTHQQADAREGAEAQQTLERTEPLPAQQQLHQHLGCHGATVRGAYGTPEAGTRTAHVQ
eukprot:scaffold116099_cov40-Phaeocystis_antarctica.AAC.1